MKYALCVAASAGLFVSVATAQETIYGMTAASSGSLAPGQSLVSFQSNNPGSLTTIGAFSGILAGHSLREIDFRPATGQLYGVSTDLQGNMQIYTIDITTAAATPLGASFAHGSTSAVFSMDFNPVADRIRLISRSGTSLRVNPGSGALVATDTAVAYATGATPDVSAFAYSNNVPGGSGGLTTLYAWDYSSDSLITIGGLNGTPSPNTGQAFNVFTPSGFRTFNAGMGMDISGATGIAYVSHDDPNTGAPMGLYTIDLTTGAENLIGTYGGVAITDIAVIPSPGAAALMGLAGLAGLRRRR